MRFPVCLQVKHLQRLAASLRHAIQLPPLRHAIRLLPPLIPRPTRPFPQQKLTALERCPQPAPRRPHATRQPLLPAIPAATQVAFPPLLAAAELIAFPPVLAAEPATAAVISAAMAIAEMDFSDVAAAMTLSSGKCSRELAGLAT